MRKCLKCGTRGVKKNKLTEHHVLPRRWFSGSSLTVTLCRSCHDDIEKLIPYPRQPNDFYFEIIHLFLEE